MRSSPRSRQMSDERGNGCKGVQETAVMRGAQAQALCAPRRLGFDGGLAKAKSQHGNIDPEIPYFHLPPP